MPKDSPRHKLSKNIAHWGCATNFEIGSLPGHCVWSFSWVAMINYGYLVTPPTLAATMASLLALLEFILCKICSHCIGIREQLAKILTVGNICCHYTCFLFSVKSLASLIGGQLIGRLGLSLPQLFRLTAHFTLGLGGLYYLLYYTLAKKKEIDIIEELDRNYPQRKSKITPPLQAVFDIESTHF